MIWLDLALVVILIIFVTIGFWKGFMFSILSLFSSFINFIIALLLTKPTSMLLNNWFKLDISLTNAFSNKLTSLHSGFNTNLVGLTDTEIKSHISSTLESSNFPLPKIFNSMLNITNERIGSKSSLTLNDVLSRSLGTFFSLVITFIILFILIYIILFILSKISKKSKESESIRTIDRIFGVIFGLIKGIIFIVFIFAILSFFKEDGALKPLFDYINNSEVSGFIYKEVNTFVDKYITLENVVNNIK